jgi:hypothetical protein
MMYNIGLDISPTELVCVSPPGVIFERSHPELLEKQLRSRDKNLENTFDHSGAGNSSGILIYSSYKKIPYVFKNSSKQIFIDSYTCKYI